MTETNPKPGRYPPAGPISQRLSANSYLEEKKIPQIFESLLACLMLECPDDHMTYLNEKLDQIKEIGAENIAWDTFIVHLRSDKTREQPETTPESDLPHDEPITGSFTHSELLEPPVADESSHIFQLTDYQTIDANVSEASATNVFEASATNVFEASATNVFEASGTNVFEASETNVSEASGTNVSEASGTNVFEASPTNVSTPSGANDLEFEL